MVDSLTQWQQLLALLGQNPRNRQRFLFYCLNEPRWLC